MTRIATIAMVLAAAGGGSAQTQNCSARAIFLAKEGAIPPCPAMQEARAKGNGSKPVHAGGAQPGPSVEISALKYWIELFGPGGEVQRVTTARRFHSGERIRLHFESNVAGRLTIAQKKPDGSSQVLYPDPKVNRGDSFIAAKTDTAIPPNGAFHFDNETGTDQLLVFLEPGMASSGENQVAAGGSLNEDQTGEMVQQVQRTRGLVLESDEKAGQTAQYAAAPGSLALLIKLIHQ